MFRHIFFQITSLICEYTVPLKTCWHLLSTYYVQEVFLCFLCKYLMSLPQQLYDTDIISSMLQTRKLDWEKLSNWPTNTTLGPGLDPKQSDSRAYALSHYAGVGWGG